MEATKLMGIALLAGMTAFSSAACNRNKSKPSAANDVQVQTPVQQPNVPMTLTGCLKAGEAADTFVLMRASKEDGGDTANYQLIGASADQLRGQVGKRIQVSGVLRTQQETASASPTEPANRAKGTSGTPTVSTTTEIDVRRLDVQSVQPLGDKCEM